TGVVEGAFTCLSVQAKACHMRYATDVGFADTDDGDFVLQGSRFKHFYSPQLLDNRNCGTFRPSPRSSNSTETLSPIFTVRAFSPRMFAIMRGPSSSSIRATT